MSHGATQGTQLARRHDPGPEAGLGGDRRDLPAPAADLAASQLLCLTR